jgi:hypothetical protein
MAMATRERYLFHIPGVPIKDFDYFPVLRLGLGLPSRILVSSCWLDFMQMNSSRKLLADPGMCTWPTARPLVLADLDPNSPRLFVGVLESKNIGC